MAIKQKLVSIGLACLMLCYPLKASASWIGPTEIMQGGWGSGDGEFGFRSGDTRDQFPLNFLVLSDGKIVIEDWVNNRLNIYKLEDKHSKFIIQPGLGLYELNSDKIVSFKWDDKIRSERIGVFSLSEDFWLWDDKTRNFDSASAKVLVLNNNIFIWDGKNGYQYSPTGQLLKTYTERPLELGVIKKGLTTNEMTKLTIEYPNKKYLVEINEYSPEDKIVRDLLGDLYVIQRKVAIIKKDTPEKDYIQHYIINRFDSCSDGHIKFDLPEDKYEVVGYDTTVGRKKKALVRYGEPVISPNGDAYAWKYTPEKYSILKWTWQGLPDSPQSLRATASKVGITLLWEQPQKDANAVTSYEINRSGNVCGPFRPIGTVKKDMLTYEDQGVKPGETWYYQVRAIRDKTSSGYSNKAVGTR